MNAAAVHELFRARHKLPDGTIVPAGAAAGQKGEFALALAERLLAARAECTAHVVVPEPLQRIFEWLLYENLQPVVPPEESLPPQPPGLA